LIQDLKNQSIEYADAYRQGFEDACTCLTHAVAEARWQQSADPWMRVLEIIGSLYPDARKAPTGLHFRGG
jgi:hypothetical protein